MNFWLTLPISVLITIAFGLLVGLPSLRLRADYFAIATIAFAEAIRLIALNARDLTNGAQGIFGFDDSWTRSPSRSRSSSSISAGPTSRPVPALPRHLGDRGVAHVHPHPRAGHALGAGPARDPRGRGRRQGALARTFSYKLQSLAIAATIGAVAGWLLAIQLAFVVPDEFQPIVTFIGYVVLVLGGRQLLGRRRGSDHPLDGPRGLRFLELPISETKIAALRFIIVGLLLIGLMAFRPQGVFGKREEMVLGD